MEFKTKKNNCTSCLFPLSMCLCQGSKSRIKIPFKIIFVMNKSEFYRLSNTARLFLMRVHPCEIRIRGLKETPLDYKKFGEELSSSENFLLFPHEESKKMTSSRIFLPLTKPKTLIIPDGNWSQAAKIVHKIKEHVPSTLIKLASPPASLYKLRSNPNEDRVSTFEAAFHAIKEILQEEDQKELISSFEHFVDNVLRLRGKIRR